MYIDSKDISILTEKIHINFQLLLEGEVEIGNGGFTSSSNVLFFTQQKKTKNVKEIWHNVRNFLLKNYLNEACKFPAR